MTDTSSRSLTWGWPDGRPAKVEATRETVTLVVHVRPARSRSSPLSPEVVLDQVQAQHSGATVVASSRTPLPGGGLELRYEQVPVGWYDLILSEVSADGGRVVAEAKQSVQLVRLTDAGGQEEPHRLSVEMIEAEARFVFLAGGQRMARARYRISIGGQVWEGFASAQGETTLEPPLPPGSKAKVQWAHADYAVERGFNYHREVYVDVEPHDTDEHLHQRLHNWGYEPDRDLGGAVSAFQRDRGLAVNGDVGDETTRRKALRDYAFGISPRRS